MKKNPACMSVFFDKAALGSSERIASYTTHPRKGHDTNCRPERCTRNTGPNFRLYSASPMSLDCNILQLTRHLLVIT